MRNDLRIFFMRSMKEYAEKVIHLLKTKKEYSSLMGMQNIQGELSVSRFADGEMEVETIDSVRGKDVFLFANSARNALGLTVEENKIELYHAIDALRRASAGRITLFEPYCSPGRSDRTTRRNSVGLWVHLKTLISLGVDHILTFNLHSDKSRSMIDPKCCAMDDIPILVLLKKHLADTYIKNCENLENRIRKEWVFCSVDAGGEILAKKFANSFNTPLVIAHKQRDYSTVNKIISVHILSSTPMKDKVVWIIDDMIDTGGSIYKLVLELNKRGIREVNVAVVHAVLSPPSIERMKELIEKGLLKNILFADTIYCCDDLLKPILPAATIVSSHEIAADIIYRLHLKLSLSGFFEPFNAYEYLK
ncbi:MAG: ribose-phosphate pyrophosphokinase [Spirochaetales bacterium]|nr:ribose-phosphate pyrophosphokinase [Spirochaetales bacterium]